MKPKINPDKEFADDTKRQIKQNGGYCISTMFRDQDTKCICKEFRDQMKRGESGYCNCGLYYFEVE